MAWREIRAAMKSMTSPVSSDVQDWKGYIERTVYYAKTVFLIQSFMKVKSRLTFA